MQKYNAYINGKLIKIFSSLIRSAMSLIKSWLDISNLLSTKDDSSSFLMGSFLWVPGMGDNYRVKVPHAP